MYYPTDPIENLKGVGEWLEKNLKNAQIKKIGDLINYLPFRYEDLSKISTVDQAQENENIVLKGKFKSITSFVTRNKKKIVKAKFYDDSGDIEALWFNTSYIISMLKEDQIYMISVKPSKYGNKLNIVNPSIEKSEETNIHTGRIVPIYFNIPRIHMKRLRKLIFEAVNNTEIYDFLKEKELDNNIDLKKAYINLHFPKNEVEIERARDRIALNELIHVKLHSEKLKSIQKDQNTKFKIKKTVSKDFVKNLPFILTKDQKKASIEINKQLKKTHPMNVLLSGDVGSGKTIVAVIASLDVVKNKGKVCYLAPTVVLANQVYSEYKKYLEQFNINIELFTSKQKIKNNNWDILIGTHAVFNKQNLADKVDFIVIDEQHKFGVKQRASIIEGKNPPHVLTMTATPIPRSLALAFFDELNLVQIKTKPKGRKIITTKVIPEIKRNACYNWIKKEIVQSSKVYHIVPFVNVSKVETFKNIKSIEEMEEKLRKVYGKNNVLTLHGKMKDEEKNKVIDKFKKQKGGVLLSTQVVEVGVDVKDATVIIIESAERFGLASLHQLRGRVGRNDLKSYCFLFTSTNEKVNTKRLKYMEKENDGFKLASLDLQSRGGGEIFGIRQSGEVDLKFVDFKNKGLLDLASKKAKSIYNDKEKLNAYNSNFFTREFFYIQDN